MTTKDTQTSYKRITKVKNVPCFRTAYELQKEDLFLRDLEYKEEVKFWEDFG